MYLMHVQWEGCSYWNCIRGYSVCMIMTVIPLLGNTTSIITFIFDNKHFIIMHGQPIINFMFILVTQGLTGPEILVYIQSG